MSTPKKKIKRGGSAEHVVLVNDKNEVLGTADKGRVHTSSTPLHRAFSLFLFNPKGELLLQQRSHLKKTWPLVWSNSCCGHPQLNEREEEAVRRGAKAELGITQFTKLELKLPNFRYRAERDGIVENELCPVWVGVTDQEPKPNPEEVETYKWVSWSKFQIEIREYPESYSQWCVEETRELAGLFNIEDPFWTARLNT